MIYTTFCITRHASRGTPGRRVFYEKFAIPCANMIDALAMKEFVNKKTHSSSCREDVGHVSIALDLSKKQLQERQTLTHEQLYRWEVNNEVQGQSHTTITQDN